MRIFDVEKELDGDVFAKVVSVNEEAGFTITALDGSTFHRLPRGGKGPKPILATFVGPDTKHQLKQHKKNLKETSNYVNNDFTQLRAKLTRDLRCKDDDCGVVTLNENFFVFMQDNQKLVFHKLYKLQK